MSNALQVQQSFTPDDIKLVRDTVAKGATEEEFKLFLARCKLLNLNPLKPGHIHFVKYGNGPGSIVVGIEGFRAKAGSTGQLDGVERELVRNAEGKCIGARAKVYRKDWSRPAVMEVSMAEYNTGKGPWQKMPETMIGKVAEAAALRMAFPDQLGGVYAQEEMHQAEAEQDSVRIVAEQPGAEDGFDQPETDYRCVFGTYKGRGLEEVYREYGPAHMAKQVDAVPVWLKGKGRALTPEIKDQLERIEKFLGEKELEAIREPGSEG